MRGDTKCVECNTGVAEVCTSCLTTWQDKSMDKDDIINDLEAKVVTLEDQVAEKEKAIEEAEYILSKAQ